MIHLCQDVMLRPFVWGKVDCVTCAADVFLASFDVDPIEGLRGRWKTKREAERLLDEIGGWRDGFAFLFESNGLVRGSGIGAIGITKEPSPGLAIHALPGAWLGKSMRGMTVSSSDSVWRSWCPRS